MHYVYIMVYISLAVAMQLLTGNFPVSFFAFPLNLVFAALWLSLIHILVEGVIRPPKEGEKYFPLVKVSKINGRDAAFVRDRVPFEHLTTN